MPPAADVGADSPPPLPRPPPLHVAHSTSGPALAPSVKGSPREDGEHAVTELAHRVRHVDLRFCTALLLDQSGALRLEGPLELSGPAAAVQAAKLACLGQTRGDRGATAGVASRES
eukprot:scaffold183879_cov43-Tisochrysis_lutea.AAC.1